MERTPGVQSQLSSATVMRRSQYDSIQYLRGLAAVLVLIAHGVEHPLAQSTSPLLKTGRMGVDIFFVISGFIITIICGTGRFNPVDFARRRFIRVVPLYWFYTTAAAILALSAPQLFKSTKFDLVYYLHSMLFIPYPDPVPPHSWQPLFKLGWTLEYELFFYLAAGCLFFVKGTRRASVLCSLFFLLIFARCFFFNTPSLPSYYANLNLLPFVFGIGIGWLAQQSRLHGLSALTHGCVYVAAFVAMV